MTDHLERIAVLETNQKRLNEDLTKLFNFQRDHMEKEDARWEEIQSHMAKQKGVIGGVILTISSLWAVAMAALQYFHK